MRHSAPEGEQMRQHAILPILLLALGASLAGPAVAQSLPTVAIETFPAAPAPDDPVVLRLSGLWPDGCVPDDTLTTFSQAGKALRVHFNYAGFDKVCTAAVTPWSLDVPAGHLAEGAYSVDVTITRSLLPTQTIGTGAFTVATPKDATFWLPSFWAPGEAITLASSLTAFNNSENVVNVATLAAYDALGQRPGSVSEGQIGPNSSAIIGTRTLRPGMAVQLLEIRAPRRVSFRATLERLETVPEGLPKVPESYGRVELPVFTELVPAGMTAVAGDVTLSALECASGPEARRRVNLTIWNAGNATGTFTVTGGGSGNGPGGSVQELEYLVQPRALVQFNAVSLDSLPACSAGGAWFRIKGDQPFLAYVSTVRPETVPGILPYEIFPAKVSR